MNDEIKIKITSFTKLDAWKEGHILAMSIYKITKTFPKDETFCLISQMRRGAVSVTSNIAEGFSRQSYKEKVQFYSIALGSVTEIQNQLIISRDLEYIHQRDFIDLADQTIKVHKILNGLIIKSKSIIHNS